MPLLSQPQLELLDLQEVLEVLEVLELRVPLLEHREDTLGQVVCPSRLRSGVSMPMKKMMRL
jgi:hypothetical protein